MDKSIIYLDQSIYYHYKIYPLAMYPDTIYYFQLKPRMVLINLQAYKLYPE